MTADLVHLYEPPTDPSAVDAPERQTAGHLFWLYVFVIVPLLAVLAAIPLAWGGFVGPVDIVLLVVFYSVSAAGITVGFHRHFTHGAFKAKPWVRVGLAIAGTLAIEGPLDRWVADHRKHHAFSDKEGDPHSPWRYGDTVGALMKGLAYAHLGWLFDVEQTSRRKYAPDLVDDPALSRVSRAFPLLVLVSVALPALLGGLITWSWWGALTALFWAGLVRIALVHHVTWSINSICHVMGDHPFKSRDRSGNVWWLAIPSLGESWHNLHHADPTSARHGVEKGQIDISARLIRWMELAGWVWDVRWPKPTRLDARRA
jgi:stearoyl-CoA desaturase (delta-9 desaturase)